jgi:hypothetical protein
MRSTIVYTSLSAVLFTVATGCGVIQAARGIQVPGGTDRTNSEATSSNSGSTAPATTTHTAEPASAAAADKSGNTNAALVASPVPPAVAPPVVDPPKTAMPAEKKLPADATLRAAILTAARTRGNDENWREKFANVSITWPDWTIERGAFGVITGRVIEAAVGSRNPDGTCAYQFFNFRQQHDGQRFFGTIWLDSIGDKEDVVCTALPAAK